MMGPPPGPDYGLGVGMMDMGPGGAPPGTLGPYAAARRRRRRLIICVGLCIVLLGIIAAVVFGVLVGVLHFKFSKGTNNGEGTVVTPGLHSRIVPIALAMSGLGAGAIG